MGKKYMFNIKIYFIMFDLFFISPVVNVIIATTVGYVTRLPSLTYPLIRTTNTSFDAITVKQ